MLCCHHCQQEWTTDKRQPGTKECCEACRAYLHCCQNCRFHSPSAHNQCYIPNTEWVGDRQKLNFCDQFEFAQYQEQSKNRQKKADARNAINNIFDDDSQEKPTSFDDLFA